MLKILHTADWHLGKRLEAFSRLDEQRAVLEEICTVADTHDVDAVLIAGDLYDAFKPPVEAEELFYRTLRRLSHNGRRPVIAIAGNHDSPDRIAAPDPLAWECGILLAGYPLTEMPVRTTEAGLQVLQSGPGFVELKMPHWSCPLRLLLTPYANELRLRTCLTTEVKEGSDEEEELRQLLQRHWTELAEKYCDDLGVNILMAHLMFMRQGGEMPEEPDAERSIASIGGAQAIFTSNLPANIQYVALGHLHRYQVIDTVPCPVVYSGSPLAYSMSEAGQAKSVCLLHAEPGKSVQYSTVKLESGLQLCRKRFTEIDEAVTWLRENQDCIVELTMETEHFLTPEERRRLAQAHSRIIGPIPVVRSAAGTDEGETEDVIDLSEDIRVLFANYFRSRHAQEPGQDIISLFNEVISLDGDEGEGSSLFRG